MNDIHKILEDAYEMGRSDTLLKTNDHAELMPKMKKKLDELFTAKLNEARVDLLERVRSEVIGKDKVNHNHVWHTTAGCGCTYFTEGDKANNELKAEQRSALQKIEESL